MQSVIQGLTRNPDVRSRESYYDSGEARLRNAAGDMTFALVWLPRGQDEGVGPSSVCAPNLPTTGSSTSSSATN